MLGAHPSPVQDSTIEDAAMQYCAAEGLSTDKTPHKLTRTHTHALNKASMISMKKQSTVQ